MPTNNFPTLSDGFIVLNMTGSTTYGRVLLKVTNINLKTSRDVTKASTYDNVSVINKPASSYDWEFSCDGIVSSDTGESEFQNINSGSTYVNNTYNGLELLELIKTRTSSATLIVKLATNNYQKGPIVITSFEVSAQVNENMTYSITFAGAGDLVKTTS